LIIFQLSTILQLWKPESHRPFLNDALVDILKTSFFATGAAIGFKFQDAYISSIDGRTELELPIAMVALAATGVSPCPT
jgi:Domain of unknown function (DUF6532)